MAKIIFTERDEALALHYMLLTRQMTRLADCLQHIFRLHTREDDDGKLFKGYKAYAQSELADVICEVKRLCKTLGISFEKTEEMGDVRYEEKKQEFLKKYPDEHWI